MNIINSLKNFLFGWVEFLWKMVEAGKNVAIEKTLAIKSGLNGKKVESLISKNEQLERKVQCRTMEGKIFEVSSCLLMQSKLFSEMCTNLNLPIGGENGNKEGTEEDRNEKDEEYSKPFVLELSTIKAKCFRRIVDWMRHRRGNPEFELKFGRKTGQQSWFAPDEWECKFGFGDEKNGMDLEQLKELYLAANFLNLESLFHYCVQELALRVLQANNLKNVRQILRLADDMSEEEKEAICNEFDLHIPKEIIVNLGKRNVEKILLPPELIHPIFAKLPLSDQRWLLTLNRDAYEFLAGRVRENWPKWKEVLNRFINGELSSTWYYGCQSAYIPTLRGNDFAEWNALRLLADRALQTDLALTWDFVNDAINSSQQKSPIEGIHMKSQLERAIDHVDKLLQVEEVFQNKLTEIMHRFENTISMNAFKRGLQHLIEQRRQIVGELKETGLNKLKEKLADLENELNEYWLRSL